MKDKSKNKNGFKIRHVLVLVFIIYICSTLISQKSMIKKLKLEKQAKEEEIQVLQSEIGEIKEEIKEKDSLEFVEKVAREELRMVKPREIIYIDKNKNKDPFLNNGNN